VFQKLAVAVVILAAAGCGHRAAANGKAAKADEHVLSIRTVDPVAPSLMIARRSPRTALIVIDGTRYPDVLPIVGTQAKLSDLHEFARRDLARALGNYFDSVRVVDASEPRPAEPHVVVDLKLDRINFVRTGVSQTGVMTYTSGTYVLTWALALRASEQDDYLFSFAGEAAGNPELEPALVVRSMLENAVSGLLESLTEKKVHEQVLALPSPKSAPAKTASRSPRR
jgi:hypothetical protein